MPQSKAQASHQKALTLNYLPLDVSIPSESIFIGPVSILRALPSISRNWGGLEMEEKNNFYRKKVSKEKIRSVVWLDVEEWDERTGLPINLGLQLTSFENVLSKST